MGLTLENTMIPKDNEVYIYIGLAMDNTMIPQEINDYVKRGW